MREIKFRAWNIKDRGTFFIKEEFSVSNDGKILFFENGDSFDIPTEFAIQQYTGLKDKNGKEIYEGDIVKYTTNYYGNLKTGNVQVIEWIDDMEHDGFGSPLATGFLLRGYDWEVIGNIYQNPELLK